MIDLNIDIIAIVALIGGFVFWLGSISSDIKQLIALMSGIKLDLANVEKRLNDLENRVTAIESK